MDEYMRLILNPGEVKVNHVPTGTCNGKKNITPDTSDNEDEDETPNEEYILDSQEKELASYDAINAKSEMGAYSCIDSVTELRDETIETNEEERFNIAKHVYNKYMFIKPERDELPIDAKKSHILTMLKITNVIIIHGDTGCGKTTRVPQYILDEAKETQAYCNIVVTQPRKIAAISVARHVCQERGWDVGSICGYQVGLEKINTTDTILTYMTAGVLLQKLILRKNLNEYTHIIIDEVHERTQEIDFLLIILRRFLNTNSVGVKIILMSATFETDKFAEYFKSISDGRSIPASQINVQKKIIHDKSIHYLEELSTLGNLPDYGEFSTPKIHQSIYDVFVMLLLNLSRMDDDDDIGHVLVFLPGIYEIEYCYSLLMKESQKSNAKFFVVPLHSSIPAHEQSRVFVKPPALYRKIILSTNIAESSITVPDIVYVIDFCLTKIMVTDPITQFQSLQLNWASQTNAIQRAGRVGRVRSGRVYRLVYRNFYERDMPKDIPPEMQRASLERVVLMSKRLQLSEMPHSILGLAMDPPNLKDIKSTIKMLKEAGAMLRKCRGRFIDCDGDLTMLGEVMSNLPLNVKLSKLVCLGYLFSCLEECVIMAAGCSFSNIFSTPFQERLTSYTNKLVWADGSHSDLLAYLSLFTIFDKNFRTGQFAGIADERRWCQNNYISHRAMREWRVLVEEITQRLEYMHIRPEVGPCHVDLSSQERQLMLKIAIAGAFYPNYYTRSSDAGRVDEKEIYKQLKGLNASNTVYFSNMDMDQPGPLYEERIKEIIRPITTDCTILYDASSKIYVSFNDTRQICKTVSQNKTMIATMPGKLCIDVYKAIRMRHLKLNTSFPVMRKENSWIEAEKAKIAIKHDGYYSLVQNEIKKDSMNSVLPKLGDEYMMIRISHFIDAGHFYAQPANETISTNLKTILGVLNNKYALAPVEKHKICLNALYACKFVVDNLYYRCIVTAILPFMKNEFRVKIIFIDYGNSVEVTSNELRNIPEGVACYLPPQAFHCTLSGIQPTVLLNLRGNWSQEVNMFFREKTRNTILNAKIYSVLDDIVSLELFVRDSNVSINTLMVNAGMADKAQPSLLDRQNNELRQRFIKSLSDGHVVEDTLDMTKPVCSVRNVEAPKLEDCVSTITLSGPYSPLEMSVYALCKNSDAAMVDSESVNCVLLDSEPQNPHERLLVASSALQKQHSLALSLRHTTLMPYVPGLPALVALMFCPTMLLKTNDNGTHYVSVLCGLGADSHNRPIYADHDLRIHFDVDINVADLRLINEIRFCMNKLMHIVQMKYAKKHVPPHRHHNELKKRILKLLEVQRESMPRVYVRYADSWTKSVYEGAVEIPAGGAFNANTDIWPLHSIITLCKRDDANIRENLSDLTELARGYKKMEDTVCKLCDVEISTLAEVRMHICTNEHKMKLRLFNSSHSGGSV